MRHAQFVITLVACWLAIAESQAQQIVNRKSVNSQAQQIVNRKYVNRKYNNVSLSEALLQLNNEQTEYIINFLYNDLEDFRITTTVSRKTVPDAIQQMIGFYPIRMTVKPDDHEIYVECTHKTDRRLTGTIIDEQGCPVAYANIAILHPADSTLLSGGVSNESGYFAIPYERPAVLARISYVGYKTIYKICNRPEVGTIRMQPDNYTLKGVTVKGYQPTMKMISGGMKIEVQNTLLADAGSGLDVLAQLPRVNVTANGGVEVFGKGKPEIYINGKKMRSKEELDQLTSKEIKSVEIITMPGARYNAELGSVIRISTIKRLGDGFSLYSMARGAYFHDFSNATGVSVTYRKSGLEMNFYPYFVNNYIGEDNHFGSTLHLPDHDTKTLQHGLFTDHTQYFIPDFKLSYDFNVNHSVGASYRIQKTVNSSGRQNTHYDVLRNNLLEGCVETGDTRDWDVTHHNADAYYSGKVGSWELHADGSYVHTIVKRGQDISETSEEYDDRTIHTQSTQDSRLYAAKLFAATCPFGSPTPVGGDLQSPTGELSFGTEFTYSHVNADNHNAEGYIRESDDEMRERNYAFFASYDLPLGHWRIEAGVRYEYVHSLYYSYGVLDKDVSRHYSGLYPNVSASWNKGKWGLQFGYSKKTRRPSYGQLRSYQQYDNRYVYEGGNPRLQPAIYHTLEGMLNWQWLNFSLSYRYQKDFMLWKNDLYGGERKEGRGERIQKRGSGRGLQIPSNVRGEIAYATFINIDHKQEVVASLVLQPKFGWYRPELELGYVHQFFDAKKYGFVTNLRRPAFTAALRNKFVIDKSCWVGLRGRYVTSHDNVSQEVDAVWTVSAHAYKSFFNGALAFSLTFNDIFNTYYEKWRMRTHSVEISKDCNNHGDTRGISLQVTYKFNTARSKYKGTGAGNDEKKRL